MPVLKRGPSEARHEFQSRRRAEAARLFDTTDLPIAEVARQIGVTRKYVSKWHTQWEQGVYDFKTAHPSGGQSRLTDEQKEQIRHKIIAGAKACGFAQDLWNQQRIADLIERETGVKYHYKFIRVFMASLQISYQKPALRAKEQNEAKVSEFIQTTFPEAKKGHSTTGQP